jgi:hypothetical protein
MIYALNPTFVVRCACVLTLGIVAAWLWIISPDAGRQVWGAKSILLAIPNGLIFLLTIRFVFRWVHRVTFARFWLFPLLDGEWEGEVHSNWPRIRAMMEAARGAAPSFNVLSDRIPEHVEVQPVPIRATIESGLLDIKIKLVMSETRYSHTVFVKPERLANGKSRLYYVYQQQEDAAVDVTDTSRHQGAACLDFDPVTGVLSGIYWTERKSELGLNTAGRIRLQRCRK